MQQPDYPERFQTWPELMTTQDVADAFGWTNEEMLWLCMNGPQVKLN